MRHLFQLPGKRMMRIGMWVMACNYAVAVLSGGVNLYLASVLGEESFGIYSYALVLATIVFTVTSFGAERTLVRDLVQSQSSDAVMSASIRLRLKLALVVGLVMTAWVLSDRQRLGGPAVGMLGLGLGLCLALSPNAWFDARREMHKVSLFQLAEKAAFAAIVFTAIRGPEFTLPAIGALLLFRVANCAGQWLIVRRRAAISLNSPAALDETENLWQENRFICLAAVSNLALTHASQLMLSGQGGSRLGQYALAFQIVVLLQVTQNQLTRLVSPRVAQITGSEYPRHKTRSDLFRLTAIAGIVSSLITVPVMVFGPWAIGAVFRDRYQDVGPALRVLCLWTLTYGPALVVNRFLIGLRLTRPYFAITVTTGLFSIALSLYAVPRWGGVGAAASLLIAHSCSNVAQLALVLRTIHSQMRNEAAVSPASDLPKAA